MKFIVYHAISPTFTVPHPEFTKDNYKIVATVDTIDVEEVFRLTNHIDHPWWENKEVTWYATNSRSTSVGDVVVDGMGCKFRCEICGFSKIEKIEKIEKDVLLRKLRKLRKMCY